MAPQAVKACSLIVPMLWKIHRGLKGGVTACCSRPWKGEIYLSKEGSDAWLLGLSRDKSELQLLGTLSNGKSWLQQNTSSIVIVTCCIVQHLHCFAGLHVCFSRPCALAMPNTGKQVCHTVKTNSFLAVMCMLRRPFLTHVDANWAPLRNDGARITLIDTCVLQGEWDYLCSPSCHIESGVRPSWCKAISTLLARLSRSDALTCRKEVSSWKLMQLSKGSLPSGPQLQVRRHSAWAM